jgi:prevent-host-death family protein
MTIRIGMREARNHFADLLGQVRYGGQSVIIERAGKPMAAVVPVELFERIMSERELRFQKLDDLLRKIPEFPEDEVERDIAETIAAVRAAELALPAV